MIVALLIPGLFIVLSYLAGSIPFGVLIARTQGVDIRKIGSGNIGATNVARTLGWTWGMLVFVLDFLKGAIPTLLAQPAHAGPRTAMLDFLVNDLHVVCGVAAVLGHVFSVWLGFRGGKAGATGLGVGTVICWQAVIAAGLVWLVVVAISRYVSLGTILGSVAFVASYLVVAIFLDGACPFDRGHITPTIVCVAIAALVIIRHKDNIRRLLDGTENRV